MLLLLLLFMSASLAFEGRCFSIRFITEIRSATAYITLTPIILYWVCNRHVNDILLWWNLRLFYSSQLVRANRNLQYWCNTNVSQLPARWRNYMRPEYDRKALSATCWYCSQVSCNLFHPLLVAFSAGGVRRGIVFIPGNEAKYSKRIPGDFIQTE
jgi:hypothetical protein